MTGAAVAGIQVSRTSFIRTLNALLGTGPFVGASVGATDTAQETGGTQLVAIGALNINLTSQGRLIPYVTVGAGVLSNTGDAPAATLEGYYAFDILDVFPTHETDTVRLRHAIDDTVFVGVLGGGIRLLLTPRSGVRVDLRVHLGETTTRTLLNASPEVATGSPSFPIASSTDPSIQFSNDPTTGEVSTLTGPDNASFHSFSVSGVHRQILGYFWKR